MCCEFIIYLIDNNSSCTPAQWYHCLFKRRCCLVQVVSFYLTLVRFFFFKFERLASCRDILLAIEVHNSLSLYTSFSRHLIKLLPKDRSKVGKIGKILIFVLYLQTDTTRRKKFFIEIITSISALLPRIPLTLADLAGAKDPGLHLSLGHSEARRVEKYSQTSLACVAGGVV